MTRELRGSIIGGRNFKRRMENLNELLSCHSYSKADESHIGAHQGTAYS